MYCKSAFYLPLYDGPFNRNTTTTSDIIFINPCTSFIYIHVYLLLTISNQEPIYDCFFLFIYTAIEINRLRTTCKRTVENRNISHVLAILLVMKFVAAQMKNHWIEYEGLTHHIASLGTKTIGHRW